ncbi:MAG: YceI family protein [Lewinellaceae bacterium]|nr:YceI family protein [Lewinellaceae bacterium]
MKKRYTIERGSRLFLKGTSNVNSFDCDCNDVWPVQTLEVEQGGNHAAFRNTSLQYYHQKFDCHNGKIDHDMQKALKADVFPTIKIELLETWQDANTLQGEYTDWEEVKAKVKIFIAGHYKTYTIAGKVRKNGKNNLQLIGEKMLKMSDFGIDPPEAMFGLIKVDDDISIHFELKVRLEAEALKP